MGTTSMDGAYLIHFWNPSRIFGTARNQITFAEARLLPGTFTQTEFVLSETRLLPGTFTQVESALPVFHLHFHHIEADQFCHQTYQFLSIEASVAL